MRAFVAVCTVVHFFISDNLVVPLIIYTTKITLLIYRPVYEYNIPLYLLNYDASGEDFCVQSGELE